MQKRDYNLWIDYHHGEINRKLSEDEYSEIAACDFAMRLLIPTDTLLKMCGGWNNLENMDIIHSPKMIKRLSDIFLVPEEVMLLKLDYLMKQKKKDENRISVKKRILKREGNVIFTDFN